jgi:hypothetical protein
MMVGTTIGKYKEKSFYLENQEGLSECLKQGNGCVDLSTASPVKFIFDKLLAEKEIDRWNPNSVFVSPDPGNIYLNQHYTNPGYAINQIYNSITCHSNKGVYTEYVACNGFVGDPNKRSYYSLDQGLDSLWYERLALHEQEERHHWFSANASSPKLGEEFVDVMMCGVKPQANSIGMTAVTGLAALAVLAGLYKAGSYYLQYLGNRKVSLE